MKNTNHFAVIVAAIVFFMLGAGWYTVLSGAWLAGIGKTMEQMAKESGGSPMPYVIGFLAVLVMCFAPNSLLHRLGDTTPARGSAWGLRSGSSRWGCLGTWPIPSPPSALVRGG